MKCLIITALATCISLATFAQEKKETTVKIVINENGKERIIEKKFSDLDQANAEIKQLNDSLDINISTSNGNKKIVRVDVNKRHSRMTDQPGKIILENIEGNSEGGPDKRVIIRRGGPKGMDKDFDIQLDRHDLELSEIKRFHKGMFPDQDSRTIHGLLANPNRPFNGKLNVRFHASEKGNVTISVADVEGKELAKEQIKDFEGNFVGQIDIKKSGSGVYFVRVTQGADGAVKRVKVD